MRTNINEELATVYKLTVTINYTIDDIPYEEEGNYQTHNLDEFVNSIVAMYPTITSMVVCLSF